MKLTDLKISKAKPSDRAQKLSDGNGMYLYISPSGVKSWRFDYTFNEKRHTHTIGQYPTITLALARVKRAELKTLLSEGISPGIAKRKDKIQRLAASIDTFGAIADEWFDSKKANRSIPWRHANELYLRRDLKPEIGRLPIKEVSGEILLAALKSVAKERGVKTADRVRQTALQVFEHAILTFKTEFNPAKAVRKWVELPAVINSPHLQENEIHDFIDAVDAYSGHITTKLAAKILLLTFVRKTEVVEAEWTEFDIENQKWIIPASRMKMKEPLVVPLSTQAVATLEQLKSYSSGSIYLFPKISTMLKPMSRASLNRMFSEMGYKGKLSPHGIRATASSWLNEKGFRHDVIERQLAHSERNQVRASYNHADYLPERRQMMQKWADFLFPLPIEV